MLASAPSQMITQNELSPRFHIESSFSVRAATNHSQTQAHISPSFTAGVKRPSVAATPLPTAPLSQKTKTVHHVVDDCEVDAKIQIIPPSTGPSSVDDPSSSTACKTNGVKRTAAPSSSGPPVVLKKPKLVLMSADIDAVSLTVAQAQRKKMLEEDPLATNVQHNSVTCNACGKVVKYTMFDLHHWNRHKSRCKSDTVSRSSIASDGADSSLTAAQTERKRVLEEDPLATNVQHNSVTCNACGKVVKYTMFDLHHWNRHKSRCKSDTVSRSSIASDGADSSLTAAQTERKRVLEEDPLATNVQHNSVTCNACGKVLKHTMFDLFKWNRHKSHCKPDGSLSRSTSSSLSSSNSINGTQPAMKETEEAQAADVDCILPSKNRETSDDSSLTAAQAERKKVLEQDALTLHVEHDSLACKACGKVVKYTAFDLFLWKRHKVSCKPTSRNTPSLQGGAKTVVQGKRFTPLVVNKKFSNAQLSTKAPILSLNEDLASFPAGSAVPPSLPVLHASAFAFTSALADCATSSTAIHAEPSFRPKTSAALTPLSSMPSARLRELKVATSGPIVRKASTVPDITLEVNSPTSLSLYHLDFPMSVPIALNRISMPPALAQRKQVARFAVILSQVAIQDLRNCVLVSRMFRYAIYLSASTRLASKFAGYRLNRIMHRIPASMMNMWPYLLQREGEKNFRRRVFEESFLGRVFKGRRTIAPQLWASPDNDKQIVIAIRFVMTRLFFIVSIQNNKEWLDSMVVDAREIIKGEIWCIDVAKPSKSLSTVVKSFYVLESTCEVVGFAPIPSKAEGPLPIQMRADWSSYINQRLLTMHPSSQLKSTGRQLDPTRSSSSIPATSLMDQLSWTNHEEFTKGISNLWLRKVKIQQEVGAAKRKVAERYILASVVENSVSGRYKTSTEMASDFAGAPTGLVNTGKKSQVKLNLYLPAHHHVESVHFTTAQGRSLHPALAVIQTPARAYYVLRDNGMQVGCEEDGVADVWMKILGCEPNGVRACRIDALL
ncbi:hypothetical protein J3R30DRAFT_3457761 [Lentinula aciculospora]|uniref:Uncharacterized protein n=1 Tax=Lentinula aciculospora TaxID=153920 RepID=A0A9W9AHR3_9AGAR|nr:hypothetical protein J3R30DRAFT_3457761 [Lentinula aciculospora]